MTVKNLIEALKHFDENATVYINGWDEHGNLSNYEAIMVLDLNPDGNGDPVIL